MTRRRRASAETGLVTRPPSPEGNSASAVELLVSWSQLGRRRSEAAFAALPAPLVRHPGIAFHVLILTWNGKKWSMA
jgi:hypothetical protein